MTALVSPGLVSKRTSLPESLAWPGAGSGQSSSLQTQLAQHRLAQKRHLLAHTGQHRHHQLHRHILQQQVGSWYNNITLMVNIAHSASQFSKNLSNMS